MDFQKRRKVKNKTIVETNNFIVLDKYNDIRISKNCYQSEADLEAELISDLENQGFEYVKNINTTEKMLENIKVILEHLNNVHFSDAE